MRDPRQPAEAARVLYARLREADEQGHDVLVACLPAASGLGIAVRDRLSRAAAPREG
ncbi:Sua5 family C-terminal domain-containing protein [Corallococcus silvisoli]|uniref:Sua5 family C-terminal domain-containing protein n=1 Tax=Corallococcus silvisoli TaxID=2697031 RepID=UPI002E2E6EC8|nr:Sua5 family C-terminal domain-containing protein [Corallococcus silvisoli]